MTTASLTPDAAADLACDLIDEFIRESGSVIPTADIFALGEAKGQVRQTQALISSGWLHGETADDILNSEVAQAMTHLQLVKANADSQEG